MNLTSSDLPSRRMLTAAPMVAMAAKHEFRPLSGTSILFGLFFYSLISASHYALAITDAYDVQALRVLYSSLNSPPELTSWRSSNGDPCSESWKGITCEGSAVVSIDISGLGLNGTMGYLLSYLLSLKKLDMSWNNIHAAIPYQLPPNLTSLNLAGNNLSGNLPYSFSNVVSLNYLDLSFNKLSGDLPYTISSLSNLSSLYLENNQLTGSLNILATIPLTNLNVANNHFSGWIPQELNSIPNFLYSGNSFENGPAPPPPPYSTPPPGRPRSGAPPKDFDAGSFQSDRGLAVGAIVGIIVGTVVVSLILLAGLAICVWKNKKQKTGSRSSGGQLPVNAVAVVAEEQRIKSVAAVADLKPPPAESLHGKNGCVKIIKSPMAATSYTVASLQRATNSFSQEHLMGEGSLGRVYRADFPNGKTMAIKKVDSAALSLQEEDSFLQLVSNMSRLRQPNIVALVGYCAEQGQRLLVYEYIGNGSLHERLHYTEDGRSTLGWNSRVRVALGAARALEYLHEVCLPSMVHRNFKSANILLDAEMNPHLSDCGLAALTPNTERQITTQLVGSFGYSAPEFALSGLYTVKSDVYSFGVVMLELLTGRKPLDGTRLEPSLVRWATPQLHDIDALAKMVDPALDGMYPAKSLSRFAAIIALCTKPQPQLRPPMSEIVQALARLAQRRPSDESSFTWKTTDHVATGASFCSKTMKLSV